ncbi:DNA-methyltransferase [Streptobacillus moniliformis]|uniref:DNA-methyltransferase n=1 Tax=Streptobacillus moniliformis TaxID=34105 RepID=UPI0007EEE59A|nr:site-specific DNA-methyltransferase [Streptobacillus moniliformis]
MKNENINRKIKSELYNDHFQNYKKYGIPKAQLVIADIPYNLGNNAYASNLEWYIDGDNKKGKSKKANKSFFDTDHNFKIAEFFHFCSKLIKPEPSKINDAGCMIVFCSFQQIEMVVKYAKKYGFKNYYPLIFIKKTSAQVLKANMKVLGATEYALVLYRDKLPKFRNGVKKDENGNNIKKTGKMVLNWFNWELDDKKEVPKIHPTQKPVKLLKQLIKIFTDEGDVIIDPVAGSGSTLRASKELGRHSYGFEIKKDMYKLAKEKILVEIKKENTLFEI